MLTLNMLAALALLGAASALDPSLTFHYIKYPRVFRRNEIACQVCYGEFDCLSMDRCGYNAAVSHIFEEDDGMNIVDDALKTKVDSMMYDLVLEDTLKVYNECVPFISSYTNCNKENICLGCQLCSCDETGRWNCSETSKCSNSPLNVDHKVLTSIINSLQDGNPSRYKRSYEYSEESSTRSMFQDLVDLIGVSKPAQVIKYITSGSTIETTTSSIKNIANEDNLVFDDILGNDNLEHFIKHSEKDINKTGKKIENNDSYQFLNILKNIEEGQDDNVAVDNPHRNIDLLKGLNKYLKEKSEANEPNDQPNSINAIITDIDDIDLEKQTSDTHSVRLVLKRNVRNVNVSSADNQTKATNEISMQVTKPSFYIEKSNVTHPEKEMQHILDVVTVLIRNEQKEINHLNYVRESLLKLIKKHQYDLNVTDPIHRQSEDNSRKHGNWRLDMLHFYMNNLKRDVKDTLRDIYALQKLKKIGASAVAESVSNLKPLLFALTSYYMKNFKDHQATEHKRNKSIPNMLSSSINTTPSINISEVNQTYEPKPQRRVFQPSSSIFYQTMLIKRALTRILTIIDNDMLSTSALSPLSPKAKNIFRRIVKKQYAKGFYDVHPFIRDPNFNLTKILTALAGDWQKIPGEIHKLNPADRLYNMKLLHLTLSEGIEKIKDALTSIQFGYSRRMNFIDEHVGKNLISDISKYLASIDRHVLNVALNAIVTNALTPRRRDEHTGSVWHYIKNAFSNSKNSLVKYFQKKNKSKSYIVNDEVKRRVEEVNKQKFLEVMRRWQDNFDSYKARIKRSVKQYPKRMKNIIPKYLRGIKSNKALNGKGKPLESKGPVSRKPPMQTKKVKTQTTNRYTKHGAPTTAKYHSGSSKPVQRPVFKALLHNLRMSNSALAQRGQNKVGVPVHHATLQTVKGTLRSNNNNGGVQRSRGKPKRGVRSQRVKH